MVASSLIRYGTERNGGNREMDFQTQNALPKFRGYRNGQALSLHTARVYNVFTDMSSICIYLHAGNKPK